MVFYQGNRKVTNAEVSEDIESTGVRAHELGSMASPDILLTVIINWGGGLNQDFVYARKLPSSARESPPLVPSSL